MSIIIKWLRVSRFKYKVRRCDLRPLMYFGVGLNYDLDPTKNGSGQIYFKQLAYFSRPIRQSLMCYFTTYTCPIDLDSWTISSLNSKSESLLLQVNIANGQECTSSNVGVAGVWVSEVTKNKSGIFELSVGTYIISLQKKGSHCQGKPHESSEVGI